MSTDKYLKMQFNHYENAASKWSLKNKNPVVGGYDKHNLWEDYDTFLFKNFITNDLVALDYGTGPGRNIIKFNNRFKRIDGVDIGKTNIENAKINLKSAGIEDSNLYVCDGKTTPVDDESYDVWFSVICLQHIVSYDIRYSILEDAYRVLKPGGHICFQMGYGGRDMTSSNYMTYIRNNIIITAGYYDNDFSAKTTNGFHDVSVTNEKQVIGDLEKIGFKDILTDLRPTGPGCSHKQWIYVQGTK
jgi:ubiquinone/menaquinone biosynthesis C-methylase UbiE